MPQSESPLIAVARAHRDSMLSSRRASMRLGDLADSSSLGGRREELRGRSILMVTMDQLSAAIALIELDGIAQRLVICPPGLNRDHLSYVAETAETDAVVSDMDAAELEGLGEEHFAIRALQPVDSDSAPLASRASEWILLTSGTTGMPKMALHTRVSLTGAIKIQQSLDSTYVWSTFYDIRRYGGMQIYLRALTQGGSLILSDADESTTDFLERVADSGVTHISGTPSHWRRALMSPALHRMTPRYVRLSGEIIDQAILDNLKSAFPAAKVVHAFASTEAGVGFEVHDGLAGFPAEMVGSSESEVEIKVEEGSLRIRSERNAARYLSSASGPLAEADGFVDTRDMVERRGDRYYFVGRRDGIINVGGLKVYPEEIEAVINRHPEVRMSLVKSRRNPITGAIVVADVMVKEDAHRDAPSGAHDALKDEILSACREALAPYKVPAQIRFVASLGVANSGKLARVQ
ncbi:MAG TPA: fatty acid--CoA ligase family protein [Candidatus Binataceae bacterium]|nr:fatty acid--CoA ligase family protein [Candidatus Binataceae bacterium]